MYKKIKIWRKKGVTKELYIVTKDNKRLSFEIGSSSIYNRGAVIDFSDIIISKNKNVLIDKTEENKKILKEKYGIEL